MTIINNSNKKFCKELNNDLYFHRDALLHTENMHEGVSKSFRTESITKYTLTTINTYREAT